MRGWFVSLIVILACVQVGFTQENFTEEELYDRYPVDTVETIDGDIVFFSDKSWEYLELLDFDGITNPYLYDMVASDTNYNLELNWSNHVTIPYPSNPVDQINDSIWMCVVDTNSNGYCIPFDGRVTSTFKFRGRRFHHGVDIDLETGDTVRAAFDGIVRYAKYNKSGFGKLVIIRHYNGLETYYAHLSKLAVVPNQKVSAGDVLGLGGETGHAYGDHLHFEVRFYDHAIDPELIFDFQNKQIKDENLFVHKNLFDYKTISSSKRSSGSSGSSRTINKDAKYHKVRSGDSLYELSLKYGVSMNQICKLNGITTSTILQIGQVLKLR